MLLLQLAQTLATLYLRRSTPTSDKGVITDNTHYIVRTGSFMLGITVVQIFCSSERSTSAQRSRSPWAATSGRGSSAGAAVSDREVNHLGTPSLISRTTDDVQQAQTLAIMTSTLLLSAPIMCIGGSSWR